MPGAELDGLTDRLLHRRCSRLLLRLLVRLPVSPNIVTLGGFGLGLIAAWQFWYATPRSALLGLLLYFTAAVADHADGELARLTRRESALGRWLDVSTDTATNMLVVLGMAVTASTVGGRPVVLLGAVAAAGILLSSLFVNVISPPTNRPGPMDGVLRRLANRDAFYLVLVGFILLVWEAEGRLPLLIWVLALGSHAYWLMCLGRRTAPRGR